MLLFCWRDDSRSVAGNGGKMAVIRQDFKRDRTSEKTSSTTNKKTGEGAKRTRACGGKAGRKDGAERLRQEADRRVGRNSKQLADLLTEKALGGDLASAKVLVGLAERKKPRPEPVKKRRGPSEAELLAIEPEWQGELEEDSAETGGGWNGE